LTFILAIGYYSPDTFYWLLLPQAFYLPLLPLLP
jgi:hypothetical protein